MQLVTSELQQWIAATKSTGASFEALLSKMTAIGWPEEIAKKVLWNATAETHELASVRSAVPEPSMDKSPTKIAAGDMDVSVLLSMRAPRIVVFGNLLSVQECEKLIELASPRLNRSTVVHNATGTNQTHAGRTSEGMFFEPGEYRLIQTIERRLAKLVNWPIENGEGMQILRYGPGTQYEPHYDYFLPDEAGTQIILQRGGQRVGSLVMYLNTPIQGGGTVFPDVQLEVAPQRGNAVFFSYDRPHSSTKTLHGGAPVILGEKWVATKWFREGKFG